MAPELPTLVLPELNISFPLAPVTPPFAVLIDNMPLLASVPRPESKKTLPPV
jgi:hypothetical protein